ncbi:putative EVE domain-containing protein [Seiridium cardinale]
MPKRKVAAEVPEQELRRSTRRKSGAPVAAPQIQTATKRAADDEEPIADVKRPVKSRRTAPKAKEDEDEVMATQSSSPSSSSSLISQTERLTIEKEPAPKSKAKAKTASKPTKAAETASDMKNSINGTSNSEKSYWLLKAEPESRFENGVDVKFSIDDLASKTEPEPWDGIRNYVARNNLRAMKKGDLAFFYQSNCKEPGIVGTMEIVQEHTPDLSAHDPKAPYYDASSKPSDPKWSVVHVEFRSKFKQLIGLKELREMGKMGSPLEQMQLLKQSRLSVSRVSQDEWSYLMKVAEERGGESKTA